MRRRKRKRTNSTRERAIWLEYLGDRNGNRVPDPEEIGIRQLEGDGDFRSPECIELLKQADIVVTNPPFSLFREYVAQLIKYDKKFLILGNKNLITKKEIFPLFMQNRIWTGCRGFSGGMWFESEYEGKTEKVVNGKKLINVPSIWYTNLDHKKRHEELILFRNYTPEAYPRYVNYDAIEVSKTEDIPCDYDGLMGVPITFMDKYNPEQFKIIGVSLVLGNKKPADLPKDKQGGPAFYLKENGEYRRLYDRIVIRRRK